MNRLRITSNSCGAVRELHSVNCAPYKLETGPNQDTIGSLFGYIKPPRSRLHDPCYPYGWNRFVDVPNIFPNFDADANDPTNYDFHFTDEYIGAILKAGTQIVYRLGVSIEWASRKETSYPPKDAQKWAEICEHIIRHYNEGWANGFHYNIEYWEIWNEPENPPMWLGTREEFFELYRVASRHLKACFPALKIGGYGSCGFYAACRENTGEFFESFLTWFDDFLAMVKENNCPLDFFSWHIYTSDPEEIRKSHLYAREHLDKAGFTATESHLNEWNYGAEGGGFDNMATMVGASFCAAAMITMQDCGIDIGMYYIADGKMRYCALTDLRTGALEAPAHVFAAVSRLYRAHTQTELIAEPDKNGADMPYALAATDRDVTLLLLSSYAKEASELSLQTDSLRGKTLYRYTLSDASGFRLSDKMTVENEYRFSYERDTVTYIVIGEEGNDATREYLF